MKIIIQIILRLLATVSLGILVCEAAAQTLPPGTIVSVAWSPDGTRIAGAGVEGFLRIWDAATGQTVIDVQGLTETVQSVTWSPDSTKLATGGTDKIIKIWDSSNGQLITTLQGHGYSILNVDWSPDGNKIASAGFDENFTLRTWDVTSGQLLGRLGVGQLAEAVWSPDSTQLAIVNTNTGVYILDATLNISVYDLDAYHIGRYGNISRMGSVDWSPDGSKIAIGGADGLIDIWDTGTKQFLVNLRGHTGWVGSVTWSPDGNEVASGSLDNTVRFWDALSGTQLQVIQSDVPIYSVTWSPDGSRLAYGDVDSSVEIVPAPQSVGVSQTGVLDLQSLPDPITTLAWSPDGDRIAVAGGPSGCSGIVEEFVIQILDAETLSPVKSLVGNTCQVLAVDWSPDGQKLVSTSLGSVGIRIWDVDSEALVLPVPKCGQGMVSVKWKPGNDNVIVFASVSDSMGTLDATTGTPLSNVPVTGLFMDWNPDGTRLLVGRPDMNPVYLVDMPTGTWQTLEGHTDGVGAVDWSPDGTQVASAGPDGIRIWNARDGAPLQVLTGHADWITEVVFSPDSRKIASASNDGTVRIWDVNSGQAIEVIHSEDRVYGVDWSPDGSKLAYGGIGGSVEIVPAPQSGNDRQHPTRVPITQAQQNAVDISTTNLWEIDQNLCPSEDHCGSLWRLSGDGKRLFLYTVANHQLYVIDADNQISQHDLSGLPGVKGFNFDFTPYTENSILFYDEGNHIIHEYNLSSGEISEPFPGQRFVNCSNSRVPPYRTFARPFASNWMLTCSFESSATDRNRTMSLLNLTTLEFHDIVSADDPEAINASRSWSRAVVGYNGAAYMTLFWGSSQMRSIVPDFDQRSEEIENFILRRTLQDASWSVIEVLKQDMQVNGAAMRIGELIGVDVDSNMYFYNSFTAEDGSGNQLTKVNVQGEVVWVLPGETFGGSPFPVAIDPDGRLMLLDVPNQDTTVGISLSENDIKSIPNANAGSEEGASAG